MEGQGPKVRSGSTGRSRVINGGGSWREAMKMDRL